MDGDHILRLTYRTARRIVVAVVGATLIAVGIVLVFLPGPAFVVLGMGLAVLAIEFAWARRWLKRLRDTASETARRVGWSTPGDTASGDATPPEEAGSEGRERASSRPADPDA